MSKKGQVTIFVIIGIVIVAAAIFFFAFTDVGRNLLPDNLGGSSGGAFDIQEELDNCVLENEIVDDKINLVLQQGGDLEPDFFYLYQSIPHNYLCYSSDFYESCINQQPLLIPHVESEISKSIRPLIASCIERLEEKLDSAGYETSSEGFEIIVDMVQNNVNIKIDRRMTISKDGASNTFEGFTVMKESEAYQLVTIAISIVSFETIYGDSDPVAYMALYPNTRVEKLKMGDGTTLYKVSDRNTEEEFNFATRSYALPVGYGF